jgi:hypothetical protein
LITEHKIKLTFIGESKEESRIIYVGLFALLVHLLSWNSIDFFILTAMESQGIKTASMHVRRGLAVLKLVVVLLLWYYRQRTQAL